MNPTLIGLFSVLVWGISMPFVRLADEQLGAVAVCGFIFGGAAVCGLINHLTRRKKIDNSVFKNPFFYARWVFFVLHEGPALIATALVRKENIPFVILLHYLWPTAIILCSILLAGVTVQRRWIFGLGTAMVVAALGMEIIGPSGLSLTLFADRWDCVFYGLAAFDALCWGLYSAISRRSGDVSGGGGVIPMFQATLGLMLPVSFLPSLHQWGHVDLLMIAAVAAYCFLQYLAYLSWDIGMRLGNIVVLSLIADFIPWVSLMASHFMLGVNIGDRTLFSALFLVGGAMVTRYATVAGKGRGARKGAVQAVALA